MAKEQKEREVSVRLEYAVPKDLAGLIKVENIEETLDCSLDDLQSALLVYLAENESNTDNGNGFEKGFGLDDIERYNLIEFLRDFIGFFVVFFFMIERGGRGVDFGGGLFGFCLIGSGFDLFNVFLCFCIFEIVYVMF
ncbi:MAG: hypothetical protein GY928_25435 [Colwellia sp.]|nr:hypothetical protein [Colwellia sp.]